MNEFELIARFFDRPAGSAVRGIGDDCAGVRPAPGRELSITTDMLVEGRHFLGGDDPRALGHKALAVNLSDLAASGATPRWFTLAIGLPAVDEAWLAAFSEGLFALAGRHGAELIGGDTVKSERRVFSITAIGELPAGQALTRAGARPGDELWVSGELGGAALALVRPALADAARRLHWPEPRVALGEALRGLATAAIDVSDGLSGDLGHIASRSRVALRVDYDALPASAALAGIEDAGLRADCLLSGGDDYELAFAAPASSREAVEAIGARVGLRLTRIGAVLAGDPRVEVLDAAGRPVRSRGGYDHFGARE